MDNTKLPQLFTNFSLVMAVIFGILTAWSALSGHSGAHKTLDKEAYNSEELTTPQLSFKVTGSGPVGIRIHGLTLNNSWVWVKAVIIDSHSVAVLEHEYNLSYYHGVSGGESWSEGDTEATWYVDLPVGKYQVLVYGEDKSDKTYESTFMGRTTSRRQGRPEKIGISVVKGPVLSRYFLCGFIAFLVFLGFGIHRTSSKKSTYSAY